ncbi:MAG: hypothetical protein HYY44_08370, partial [Deltaproteobacteria bacterium]|nr:hypothetical protein [Deltaproteobacteria bacterium]
MRSYFSDTNVGLATNAYVDCPSLLVTTTLSIRACSISNTRGTGTICYISINIFGKASRQPSPKQRRSLLKSRPK